MDSKDGEKKEYKIGDAIIFGFTAALVFATVLVFIYLVATGFN